MNTYTQAYIKTRLNSKIQNKIGMLLSPDDTINEGARELNKKLLMDSKIRKATLSPSLMTGKYDYILPEDFNGRGLIDIPAIGARRLASLEIVSPTEFDVRPRFGSVAIDSYNDLKIIKIFGSNQSSSSVLTKMSTITGDGGTWEVQGDAIDIREDSTYFPYTNPVLAFDLDDGGLTMAGLKNTNINQFDISQFISNDGLATLKVYLNLIVGLNSITLKLGTDSSNYYYKTITVQYDGSDFRFGDNKLYFSGFSKTGSPTPSDTNYVSIELNLDSDHASALNFAMTELTLLHGFPTDIKFYSDYNWIGSDGTYKFDADDPSDVLLAQPDEFELHLNEMVICAMRELDYPESKIQAEEVRQEIKVKEYRAHNPSDILTYTTLYQDFSGDGNHTTPTNNDNTSYIS